MHRDAKEHRNRLNDQIIKTGAQIIRADAEIAKASAAATIDGVAEVALAAMQTVAKECQKKNKKDKKKKKNHRGTPPPRSPGSRPRRSSRRD